MTIRSILTPFINTGKYDKTLFSLLSNHKHDIDPILIDLSSRERYLRNISNTLKFDVSIDKQTHYTIMHMINNMLKKPMSIDHILTPAYNNYFAYDPNWHETGVLFKNRTGDTMEGIVDNKSFGRCIIVNHDEQLVHHCTSARMLNSIVKIMGGIHISERAFLNRAFQTTIINDHTKTWGWHSNKKYFNVVESTEALSIINSPSFYSSKHEFPHITLKYLQSLIPNNDSREYVLRFLKTKFTSFAYSPIILNFVGVQGSGKDVFVSLLSRIDPKVGKPTPMKLKSHLNEWMRDTAFIHLDEYSDKLPQDHIRSSVIGCIKSISGSPNLQLNKKDLEIIQHHNTFILTSNKNPFDIVADDRRFVTINCPYRLDKLQWVKDYGGISKVVKQIEKETLDFSYYLGTHIEPFALDDENYMVAQVTPIRALTPTDHIAYLLENNNIKELISLFLANGINKYNEGWEKDRLYFDKLYELYKKMANLEPSRLEHGKFRKAINKAMGGRARETKTSTNYRVTARFYYNIPDLHEYKVK